MRSSSSVSRACRLRALPVSFVPSDSCTLASRHAARGSRTGLSYHSTLTAFPASDQWIVAGGEPHSAYCSGGDSLVQGPALEKRMIPLSSLQNDRLPVVPGWRGTACTK